MYTYVMLRERAAAAAARPRLFMLVISLEIWRAINMERDKKQNGRRSPFARRAQTSVQGT